MQDQHAKIIMVDDDITNLLIAKNNLEEKYDVFTAPSAAKMFQILEKISPDLILLDIDMPVTDGYEAIRMLKASRNTARVPVIFLSAKIDPESEVRGLSLGAVDYITKPFSKELLNKRIDLHILFERQKKELQNYSRNLETEVDKKTATIMELQNAILRTMAELVESRDNVTGGHIERTQFYLSLLLDLMLEDGVYQEELLSWDMNLFIMSSQLHDIGKISIRDDILMKPGKLTDEEYDEMKKHTAYGVDIIERIREKSPETTFLEYAKILAGTHHEKWDGSGYPNRLSGADIPLMGRLMALADVYDALTNDRPYKRAFSHEKSVEIIRQGMGVHFDPRIGDVFLAHEKDFQSGRDGRRNMPAGTKKTDSLQSALNLVANIVDTRGGSGGAVRMRRCLEVLIGEMAKTERYGKEVSSWDTELFLLCAQLHDAGKLAVPDTILNKTDRLTKDEYEDVKTHTDFGLQIIRHIKETLRDGDLLQHAEALAHSHHEKWDGSGYPQGLKGEAIPLQGRLMALVDVYDALTSDRPHRVKISHEEAVGLIKEKSGTYFDPGIVSVFLKCEREIKRAAKESA